MTHEEQIPTWSYINFQILYQIHLAQQRNHLTKTTIADVIEEASKHIQSNIPLLSFYSPINAGTIFSFLYSLLVVPKELYQNNPDFFDNFKFELHDYFQIEIGHEKLFNNKNLFRVLRNSISHVNYLIDKTDSRSVVLWNINKEGSMDVKLKSDINKLGNFAVELAKYYAQKPKTLGDS